MEELVELAWREYRANLGAPWLVKPSIPILWFGNTEAYLESPCRVLTVGLNPSLREFPAVARFQRFPDATRLYSPVGSAIEPIVGDRYRTYTSALNGYFQAIPYSWFGCYEPILRGLGASYYGGQNTALHTDLCSPLATQPTWSHLEEDTQNRLMESGVDLWHGLVDRLAPDVVLVSIRAAYRDRIRVDLTVGPSEIIRIERRNPYDVTLTWMHTSDAHPFLLAFGRADRRPFGKLNNAEKEILGRLISARLPKDCQ